MRLQRASLAAPVVFAFCALALLGMARAIDLAWICDDAFISLRYAENLVAGTGLVYNAGEYVEGYTNLLFTLAVAGAIVAGAPATAAAEWLGIGAFAGLVATLALASWRRSRRDGSLFLPFAAAIVLVSDDFLQWASGGLETSLFAWLVAAGLLMTRTRPPTRGAAIGAGTLLSLLVLTRPDGAIFAAAGAASWLLPAHPLERRRRLELCLLTLAPLAVTGAALVSWKLSYYGELLPTAFYSKSVLRPYWGQGLTYAGLFVAKNWLLPVALVAALGMRWRRRGAPASDRFTPDDRDDGFLLASAGLFVAYLVHVGGDFMFARRLLPAVPLILFALEGQLQRLRSPERRVGITAVALLAAALPYPIFDETRVSIAGIADERRYYPDTVIAKRRVQAEAVGRALAGLETRVMFEGGMCVFGYYSGLPYLAEMTGLTQYSLAKLPLDERGWIGHEKRATEAWLDENDIQFVVSQHFPPVERPARLPLDSLYFGNLAVARIHRYDAAIMDRLRARDEVRFVPIEGVLDRRRRELERVPLDEAQAILDWLDRFYFDGAGDAGKAARAELQELLESRRRGQ